MPNVYQFKDFEGSSHRILIGLVRRFAQRRGTLLDLGASGGELAGSLREAFDRRIGFEFDVDRIGALHHALDSAVIADLERVSVLPSNVDAIVLADVLEHLRNPGLILTSVRKSLKPDGYLFVSVPNIANITTRLGLLFGIFRYRDRGILDSTHLRFYTSHTIRQEIERAGFDILLTRGSAIPVRLITGSLVPEAMLRASEWLLIRVTQLWKALLAYQIIVVARRKE
ncbi:MAG: class I SAM-dependent methyltransferase [Acidobacteriota bacterium]